MASLGTRLPGSLGRGLIDEVLEGESGSPRSPVGMESLRGKSPAPQNPAAGHSGLRAEGHVPSPFGGKMSI